MAEFEIPPFLQNCSEDDFTAMMNEILPTKLDKSEGSHTWNFTRPTALVAAFLCEYVLPEVIKLINPETSYGSFLDDQAKTRGIRRRGATAATGQITITGTANTVIPSGSVFSTASINSEPSVDYRTISKVEIPSSGSIIADIICTQTGIIGNTAPGTIVLVGSRLSGITAVTNNAVVSGGTEEETDESLQARIAEYDKSQGESYVGSVADYKRWAESVPGVGEATIIPAQDTSGLVTIILSDANGAAATDELCEAVYDYIMQPDNPAARLANVNATLSVTAPQTIAIAIKATIELETDATIESVKTAFLKQLTAYLPEAMDDGEVKYSRIWSALSATEGVNDFKDLQIGTSSSGTITYGTSNITITNSQLPSVSSDNLTLTSGTV